MSKALRIFVCGAAASIFGGLVMAGDLIPRETLFGNPDKAGLRLSPDGKSISFVAPLDGVLNIWVAPRGDLTAAKAITADKKRGVRQYFWTWTSGHIVYLQDKDGDENWRLYSVDVASGETKDLTPFTGVQARIQQVSPKIPDEMLIALNRRNPALHDLFRINIATGEMTPVLENNEGFIGYVTDDQYEVRLASRMTPDGGAELLRKKDGEWETWQKIPQQDALTTNAMGFDKSGNVLYMTDSRERNTAALVAVDLKTGESRLIAEDGRADISDVMMHPIERKVEAVAVNYDRTEWKVLDDAVKADLEYLRTVADGELEIISRTKADDLWIAAYLVDDGPVRYYLYDRGAKKATYLTTNRSALEGLPLARMKPVQIKSRDGLTLVSYLTVPPQSDADKNFVPDKPVPLVLFVHGGPWARDEWGFNPYHQWLANRGYAVLSVNFRGSTGFGKAFINAGDLEWGRKMHDDLLDAVVWATQEKIADPAKVAIMGGSYGGYAVLWGLTNTPDVFACGVDIVGPSNLVTLVQSVPPYWKPIIDMFATRVGDLRTEDGKKLLEERSPINYVANIKRPLLIGQGANDPRVKQAESDQIVKAMQEKKIPVTYVLFPDEGHGFARPENNLAFNAVTEAFLAEHLGGRYEPIGDDFKGSSISVPEGADQVPGLKPALESK